MLYIEREVWRKRDDDIIAGLTTFQSGSRPLSLTKRLVFSYIARGCIHDNQRIYGLRVVSEKIPEYGLCQRVACALRQWQLRSTRRFSTQQPREKAALLECL
jgi:hypothetical protein